MPKLQPPRTGLLACAKDEAPWLLEWIAHHQCLGFDEIAIATNDCSDGTDEMCDILQELGVITHIDNPPPYDEVTKDLYGEDTNPSIQTAAYARLQELPVIKGCDWAITVDIDEFLVLNHGKGKVQDLLSRYPDADGILINWRLFGDSGKKGMLEGPITDQLTKCSDPEYARNIMFRSFVRDPQSMLLNAHVPFKKYKGARKSVFRRALDRADRLKSSLKICYNGRILYVPHTTALLKYIGVASKYPNNYVDGQVNHYAVKTNEICQLKALRGNVDGNAVNWAYEEKYHFLFNRNEAEDKTISKYRIERNKNLKKLLKNDRLKGLHDQAVERTKKQLKPFAYKSQIFKMLAHPPKVSASAVEAADSKSLPTIFVMGPKGSNASLVAGYLGMNGPYYCPPVSIVNDATSAITFEPTDLMQRVWGYFSSDYFLEIGDMEEFRQFFACWHKKQTASAHKAGAKQILVKHDLLPLYLPHVHDLVDAKHVLVETPIREIKMNIKLRDERAIRVGRKSRILDAKAQSFLNQNQLEYRAVKYQEFIKDRDVRNRLLDDLSISPNKKLHKQVEDWLESTQKK